jgi:hypothetical protein
MPDWTTRAKESIDAATDPMRGRAEKMRFFSPLQGSLKGKSLSESDLVAVLRRENPEATSKLSDNDILETHLTNNPGAYKIENKFNTNQSLGAVMGDAAMNSPMSLLKNVAAIGKGVVWDLPVAALTGAVNVMAAPPGTKAQMVGDMASTMGRGFWDYNKNRYGDRETAIETFRTDPVGVLGDVATILSLPKAAVTIAGTGLRGAGATARVAGRIAGTEGKLAANAGRIAKTRTAVGSAAIKAGEATSEFGRSIQGGGRAASAATIPAKVGAVADKAATYADRVDPVAWTGAVGSKLTAGAREKIAKEAYRRRLAVPVGAIAEGQAERMTDLAFKNQIQLGETGVKQASDLVKGIEAERKTAIEASKGRASALPLVDVSSIWDQLVKEKFSADALRRIWDTADEQLRKLIGDHFVIHEGKVKKVDVPESSREVRSWNPATNQWENKMEGVPAYEKVEKEIDPATGKQVTGEKMVPGSKTVHVEPPRLLNKKPVPVSKGDTARARIPAGQSDLGHPFALRDMAEDGQPGIHMVKDGTVGARELYDTISGLNKKLENAYLNISRGQAVSLADKSEVKALLEIAENMRNAGAGTLQTAEKSSKYWRDLGLTERDLIALREANELGTASARKSKDGMTAWQGAQGVKVMTDLPALASGASIGIYGPMAASLGAVKFLMNHSPETFSKMLFNFARKYPKHPLSAMALGRVASRTASGVETAMPPQLAEPPAPPKPAVVTAPAPWAGQ